MPVFCSKQNIRAVDGYLSPLITSHHFHLIDNQILELSEYQAFYPSFHKCLLLASLRGYSAPKLNTAV